MAHAEPVNEVGASESEPVLIPLLMLLPLCPWASRFSRLHAVEMRTVILLPWSGEKLCGVLVKRKVCYRCGDWFIFVAIIFRYF